MVGARGHGLPGFTAGASLMIVRFNIGMIPTLLTWALAGMAWYVLLR